MPVFGVAFTELSVLLVVTGILVWYYRSKELTPIGIAGVIFVSWYLGFVGTLLLPIDIAQSIYEGKSHALLECWYVVYWSTFVLTWLVLPVLNDAWYAGDFTWRKRFTSAVKINLKFYAITGVLGIVFGLYIVITGKATIGGLSDFLMVFGNTYGLLLVIALLGNGLIEMPRELWRMRDPLKQLARYESRAVSCDNDLYDSICELEDAESAVRHMVRSVETTAASSDTLRDLSERILQACDSFEYSEGLHRKSNRGGRAALRERAGLETQSSFDEGAPAASEEALASLHRRVRVAQERVHAAKRHWEGVLDAAARVQQNANGEVPPPGGQGLEYAKSWWSHLWRTRLSYPILSVLAVLCGFLTITIIWSELVLPLPVNLSPFGHIISAMGSSKTDSSEADSAASGLALMALLPYLYMSLCTYYSLFKLKMFGLLELHGPQQSTPGPLLFNAIYLIRMQFPLGYNYLSILSPPSAGKDALGADVAFNELMSNMKTVPIFGQGLEVYAPLFMVVLCFFTLFNGYARLLKFVGIDHEDATSPDDPEGMERRAEGRKLIASAHRQRGRLPGSAGGSVARVALVDDDADGRAGFEMEEGTNVRSSADGGNKVASTFSKMTAGIPGLDGGNGGKKDSNYALLG